VCILNSYILYCRQKGQIEVKPVSRVTYRRALVDNLVGSMRLNPRKRSHLGSADREERQNKVSHFLYHYDAKKHKDCIVCRNRKVKGARRETFLLQDMYKSAGHVSWGMFRKIPHTLENFRRF
jgi:hypothetical protein